MWSEPSGFCHALGIEPLTSEIWQRVSDLSHSRAQTTKYSLCLFPILVCLFPFGLFLFHLQNFCQKCPLTQSGLPQWWTLENLQSFRSRRNNSTKPCEAAIRLFRGMAWFFPVCTVDCGCRFPHQYLTHSETSKYDHRQRRAMHILQDNRWDILGLDIWLTLT